MSSSESIIKPPTPEILAACDGIDRIIRGYLAARRHAKLSGRFEASTEVFSLLQLLIRLAESLMVLARHDLVLVPAAGPIARSILEAGYRASWLLSPMDPFEREARWVLYLETAAEFHERLGSESSLSESSRASHKGSAKAFRSFGAQLRELLAQRDYEVPKKYPNFRELLAQQDLPGAYHFYVILSASSHSNFEAMSFYRQGLGGAKQMGEFVGATDWKTPLDTAGVVFYRVAEKFLRDVDVDTDKHFPAELCSDFQGLVRAIR